MTGLATITMSLPASQIEQTVSDYKGNLYDLLKNLRKADKKVQYAFAATYRRIENEDGKTQAKEFLRGEFGQGSNTFVYAWLQAYDEIKEYNDEAKEKYFDAGEDFGVKLGQYMRSTSNLLEKAGEERLTSEQFIDIVEHVESNDLSVTDAKNYIKDTYLPKQEGDTSETVPNFNDEEFPSDKPVLVTVKFEQNDLNILQQWFNIDILSDDPKERGEKLYREIQSHMLKLQSSGE